MGVIIKLKLLWCNSKCNKWCWWCKIWWVEGHKALDISKTIPKVDSSSNNSNSLHNRRNLTPRTICFQISLKNQLTNLMFLNKINRVEWEWVWEGAHSSMHNNLIKIILVREHLQTTITIHLIPLMIIVTHFEEQMLQQELMYKFHNKTMPPTDMYSHST